MIPVNVMHQKIAVVDEQTVMIGSLNTLSQSYKAGANGRSNAWNQDIRFSNAKR
ncbi:phospholipase D-like domain-containing protein [Streptomyces noboritoensis]|uniref:Phospholipase D-like domain-containing protein n=1 Tax=Streptomyces noboritoensis TaxID=67337 RepID=A0ABV6TM54_9ACTN